MEKRCCFRERKKKKKYDKREKNAEIIIIRGSKLSQLNFQEISYENIAEIYDRLVRVDERQTNEELQSIQQLVKMNNLNMHEAVIADIGGGTGRLSFPLSKLCRKVFLIEPYKEMIEAAKGKHKIGEFQNIEYIQQGFLDLSLTLGSIDIAISFGGAFQYLLNLQEQLVALDRVFRGIKSDGLILFDMMNFFSIIKNYRRPNPVEWESEDKAFQVKSSHKINALKEIWEHTYRISVREKPSNRTEQFKSIHRLKMASPTELVLLFQKTGFIDINIYPGTGLKAKDGNRIWITAKKPKK